MRFLRGANGHVPSRVRVLVLDIGTRRMLHWNVTDHPTAEWTVQQFRSVLTGEDPYQFIVHDRDAVFLPAGR